MLCSELRELSYLLIQIEYLHACMSVFYNAESNNVCFTQENRSRCSEFAELLLRAVKILCSRKLQYSDCPGRFQSDRRSTYNFLRLT